MSKKKNSIANAEVQEQAVSEVQTENKFSVEAATVPEVTPAQVTPSTEDLEKALETMSLRQIAIMTGATYNVLLKASKAPVAGMAYDPEAINYKAVQAALIRKLTLAVYNGIAWEEMIANAVSATGLRTTSAADMADFVVDDIIKLRDIKDKDNHITVLPLYKILILTGTHVVLIPTTEGNTTPRVMSYDTFLHQGGKVVVVDTK